MTITETREAAAAAAREAAAALHLSRLGWQAAAAADADPAAYRAAVSIVLQQSWLPSDVSADAALYVGRYMAPDPARRREAMAPAAAAAAAIRDALRVARDTAAAAAAGPSILWDPLALPEAAAPSADPAAPFTLRLGDAVADAVGGMDSLAWITRYAETCQAAGIDPLGTDAVADAVDAVGHAARWMRNGSDPATHGSRAVIGSAATLPTTGRASAVVTRHRDGSVTVDGIPLADAARLLGTDPADTAATIAAALDAITHEPRDGKAGTERDEQRDDAREAARGPIRKPNTRKRSRDGRIGSPTILR